MYPRPWYRTSSVTTLPKFIADMSNWAGITFEMHWVTCLNSKFPDSQSSHRGIFGIGIRKKEGDNDESLETIVPQRKILEVHPG